jgi:hypothetical protein
VPYRCLCALRQVGEHGLEAGLERLGIRNRVEHGPHGRLRLLRLLRSFVRRVACRQQFAVRGRRLGLIKSPILALDLLDLLELGVDFPPA